MARYIGAVCRLCRREGEKLFLKGDKCYTDKCPFAKRPTLPGQRGKFGQPSRVRVKDYGIRLREKQKLRTIYGVMEHQFRKYFNIARRMPGRAGENLLQLLERRLDNIVYRLGFAPSRKSARQLVRHGHFLVNGRKTDIPSYILHQGDVVQVMEKSKKLEIIHEMLKKRGRIIELSWLQLDKAHLEGRLLSMPTREEIPITINENFVVEFYSR
ncbi:30S ribosomal protein S4 [bacterium]|nr:30S ribosomal protein S4 [bacterium]